MTTEPRSAEHDEARPRAPHPRSNRPDTIDSYPESRIRNSQPEGIGRVAALGELCAWNNLGRNVVFASHTFQPQAVLDETRFPDDDELSQYDLDVHAILKLPDPDLVVVLNHLGLLRALRAAELAPSGRIARVQPVWTSVFTDDVERIVAVGDRLVGSRPRHQNAGGVLVSQPLTTTPGPTLDTEAKLETWGVVTALGTLSTGGEHCIALGGDGRVSLMPILDGTFGRARWEADVAFQPAAFIWDGMLIWAAGSELAAGVDDYDWERLRGGGFAGLNPDDGSSVVTGRFTQELAWGNGGTAVVMIGNLVCGIGRDGKLHLHSARDGNLLTGTPPVASHPLGIAHAAVVGNSILYGFNRAGYQLHAVAGSTLSKLARPQA